MKIVNLKDISAAQVTQVIQETKEVLKNGGLVIFPTETTYGAGVDALNQEAVNKLLSYKSRREGKPLSIAVATPEMAEEFVEVNESARKIYSRFLPGPVTVVSKSKGLVAQGVESEFGTLGIRIPAYDFILELVKEYGRPITATSANASDAKRPYTIQDIFDGLSEKQKGLIDLVLDAGQLPPNPPSTVIDTTLSTPVVFRQGELLADQNTEVTILESQNEEETRDIAKRILLKHWNDVKSTGLVIGLNGSLGMGKTIFAKGIAEFLNISENITSPTYSYLEEYDFERHGVQGHFFHLDVWKVENEAEVERLRIDTLFRPNTVIAIEWISNIAPYVQKLVQTQPLPVVEITFDGKENTRVLHIKSSTHSANK